MTGGVDLNSYVIGLSIGAAVGFLGGLAAVQVKRWVQAFAAYERQR